MFALACVVFAIAAVLLCRGTSAAVALAALIASTACSTAAASDDLDFGCIARRSVATQTPPTAPAALDFGPIAHRSVAPAVVVSAPAQSPAKPLVQVVTKPIARTERWEWLKTCQNGRCVMQWVRIAE